jgi:hypothetical protein
MYDEAVAGVLQYVAVDGRPMEDMLCAALHPDDFDIQFRRQGWLSFDYVRPEQVDPQRLSQRWMHSMTKSYSPHAFYDLFGQNTFRKLLGHIYTHSPCPRSELELECSNATILDEHLEFMRNQELAEEVDGGRWQKATRYQHVDNIGRTLEWYVAEWFKRELAAPARYGVHVDDLADGGDLEVVAFVNTLRVWVECKSGHDTTNDQLRLFLQRTRDFSPDMAVLLIDTDGNIGRWVESLNNQRDGGDALYPQDPGRPSPASPQAALEGRTPLRLVGQFPPPRRPLRAPRAQLPGLRPPGVYPHPAPSDGIRAIWTISPLHGRMVRCCLLYGEETVRWCKRRRSRFASTTSPCCWRDRGPHA